MFHLESYGPDKPYGIINFDALIWIVIAGAVVVSVAFFVVTILFTRPVKGESFSIYIKRTPRYSRALFLNELNRAKFDFHENNIDEKTLISELNEIIIKFLQTKTQVDITGYTYSKLKESGAPEKLLELMNQIYHLSYVKPAPSEEHKARLDKLVELTEEVIRTWR